MKFPSGERLSPSSVVLGPSQLESDRHAANNSRQMHGLINATPTLSILVFQDDVIAVCANPRESAAKNLVFGFWFLLFPSP